MHILAPTNRSAPLSSIPDLFESVSAWYRYRYLYRWITKIDVKSYLHAPSSCVYNVSCMPWPSLRGEMMSLSNCWKWHHDTFRWSHDHLWDHRLANLKERTSAVTHRLFIGRCAAGNAVLTHDGFHAEASERVGRKREKKREDEEVSILYVREREWMNGGF